MKLKPKSIDFKDADEFLDYILKKDWDVDNSDYELSCLINKNWIFRGIGDSNFKLIPSAWRCNRFQNPSRNHIDLTKPDRPWVKIVAKKYKINQLDIEIINQLFQQIFLEMHIVQDFITLSNRVRLPVESVFPFNVNLNFNTPDDKHLFWYKVCEKFITWIQKFDEFDIPSDMSEESDIAFGSNKFLFPYLCPQFDEHAVAYAQHHGVPTRLLDFTYNPLKAAWFAVKQYQDILDQPKIEAPKYVSVIALHKRLIGCRGESASSYTMRPLDFIDGFKMSNFHNLFNQEGIFISMVYANKYFYKYGEWPDLNEYLCQYVSSLKEEDIDSYFLQMNIPNTSIEDLRVKLEKYDISKSYLMPSYDHVAEQILSLGIYKE